MLLWEQPRSEGTSLKSGYCSAVVETLQGQALGRRTQPHLTSPSTFSKETLLDSNEQFLKELVFKWE